MEWETNQATLCVNLFLLFFSGCLVLTFVFVFCFCVCVPLSIIHFLASVGPFHAETWD